MYSLNVSIQQENIRSKLGTRRMKSYIHLQKRERERKAGAVKGYMMAHWQ